MNAGGGERTALPRTGNVFLIGCRGCGKTGVGRRLAHLLSRPFLDLDAEIERAAGTSVAELFAREGEPHFRALERWEVVRATRRRRTIIAPGGGAVLDAENRRLLREHGICAWLSASPGELRRRLQHDPRTAAQRPALTGGDPLAEIEKVLRERAPLYEQTAHLTLDTDGRSVDDVAAELAARVQAIEPTDGADPLC